VLCCKGWDLANADAVIRVARATADNATFRVVFMINLFLNPVLLS
jgi:hypothetical protein